MSEITKGPRTSNAEFLTKHIKASVPEMEKARTLAENGDTKAAEKVFADYVRSFLSPEKLNRAWYGLIKKGE